VIPGEHFEVLDKSHHERKTFDCGRKELNDFIQQSAIRHREAGISKTFVLPVLVDEGEKADICSFYTLSHTEIKRETLPSTIAKKLPRYPIPVMLIAQLAVHCEAQNQGLGKITLIQALKHCLKINEHLPSNAVIVDALDKSVQAFYEQYGFESLDHQGRDRVRLFLPMNTIAKLFTSLKK